MRYYQWTIGSTTVRNPERLKEGLRILKDDFEGKDWTLTQQERFFDLLKKKKVYEIEEGNFSSMTSSRKQEHTRKWISILNQLGFSYAYESSGKPVVITKAGEALLNNPELEDEIFLRQLLKYQKPCVLPKQNGRMFKNVSILPFVASLKICYELRGISKEEISVFLNTTIQMQGIDNTIRQIKNYRSEKEKIFGRVKKKEFYYKVQLGRLNEIFRDEIKGREILIKKLLKAFKQSPHFLTSKIGKELLLDVVRSGKGSNTLKARKTKILIIAAIRNSKRFTEVKKIFLEYYLPLKISTLKDYADLTARYLRMSGLFSVSREKLITISDKEDFIKDLLSREWNLVENKDYLDYLSDSTTPKLPSDNSAYLERYLESLTKKEKVLLETVSVKGQVELVKGPIIKEKNILALKQQTRIAETNLFRLKEMQYYYSQGEGRYIDDILNYYDLIINKELLGGEAYYPAYLEWNTWRVFLAIDTLFNKPYEARNFKLDDELQPVDHAPGNKADMVFEYEDFIVVTEVTLNKGANQWSAEAEPVPRHIARIQFDNPQKRVYGVFVAPEIDINTVLTFYNNRQHVVASQILDLTIIPFTIEQIKHLLSTFKLKRYPVSKIKELFEIISTEIKATKNAIDWYQKFPAIIKDWEYNL
jgi:hypothetical protein